MTPPCSYGTAGAVTGRMAATPVPLTAMTMSATTIMRSGEPGIMSPCLSCLQRMCRCTGDYCNVYPPKGSDGDSNGGLLNDCADLENCRIVVKAKSEAAALCASSIIAVLIMFLI